MFPTNAPASSFGVPADLEFVCPEQNCKTTVKTGAVLKAVFFKAAKQNWAKREQMQVSLDWQKIAQPIKAYLHFVLRCCNLAKMTSGIVSLEVRP